MSRPRKLKAYRAQKPKEVSLYNGDHGTGTSASTRDTELQPMLNDDGENPNKTARRVRIDQIKKMKFLSLRQYQAAMEIRDAWCSVEKLSSGSALKEQVDSTPRPDATIAIQIDAQSRLKRAMQGVPQAMRYVVEHVCWHNGSLGSADEGRKHGSAKANLMVALDLVANRLGY